MEEPVFRRSARAHRQVRCVAHPETEIRAESAAISANLLTRFLRRLRLRSSALIVPGFDGMYGRPSVAAPLSQRTTITGQDGRPQTAAPTGEFNCVISS